MRTLLANLSILIASVIIATTAMEFALRRTPADMLGYSVRGRWFVPVKEYSRDRTKNSLGFHDKEPLQDRGEIHRILLIGDSYVESSTTSIPESVGPRLEAHLTDMQPDRIEVVSVGRGGWGQQSQRTVLQRLLPELNPDLVITVFLGFNDVVDDSPTLRVRRKTNDARMFRKRPGWPELSFENAPGLFFEWSELNRFLSYRFAVSRFSGRSVDDREGTGIPFDYLVYAEEYDTDWHAAWELKERILSETAQLVTESGAGYILVSASTPHGVLGEQSGVKWLLRSYPSMRERKWDLDKPDRLLAEFCERLDIPLLQLAEPFREATQAGTRLHWKYDGHWNAAGNDLAAKKIAEFILMKRREVGFL